MRNTYKGQSTKGLEGAASPPAATLSAATDVADSESCGRNDRSDDAPRFVDDERVAKALGIGFDGRQYRYRAYRYDELSDALTYVRLQRARPGYREEAAAEVPWLDPEVPTDGEMREMDDLAISFDGRLYHYGDYRYERVGDAVDYARLSRR